jgi:hypothetical protein
MSAPALTTPCACSTPAASDRLPVVRGGAAGTEAELVGVLHQIDALRAFNQALSRQAAEEHA